MSREVKFLETQTQGIVTKTIKTEAEIEKEKAAYRDTLYQTIRKEKSAVSQGFSKTGVNTDGTPIYSKFTIEQVFDAGKMFINNYWQMDGSKLLTFMQENGIDPTSFDQFETAVNLVINHHKIQQFGQLYANYDGHVNQLAQFDAQNNKPNTKK